MRTVILSIVVLLGIGFTAVAAEPSDAAKQQAKEKKEQLKENLKQLNEKASKAARKEAKSLSKEGWKTAPGAIALEKQLDRSYLMQYEKDKNGNPLYIMAEAMSVGGNYDAAKLQALELAKQNLAGQIQSEISSRIENTVANDQLEQGEAETLTRTLMASKNVITQRLGRLMPVVEIYRDVNGKNREVFVRLAYNMDKAKEAAHQAVKKELESQGSNLHMKLSSILEN